MSLFEEVGGVYGLRVFAFEIGATARERDKGAIEHFRRWGGAIGNG